MLVQILDDGSEDFIPVSMTSAILGELAYRLEYSSIAEVAMHTGSIPDFIKWYQRHYHGIKTEDNLSWRPDRWQFEAAWAILQNHEPPPFPEPPA
jgi:hypothetical protein